jgi:hypothetical protein
VIYRSRLALKVFVWFVCNQGFLNCHETRAYFFRVGTLRRQCPVAGAGADEIKDARATSAHQIIKRITQGPENDPTTSAHQFNQISAQTI